MALIDKTEILLHRKIDKSVRDDKINPHIEDAEFLESFAKMYTYRFSLEPLNSLMMLIIDESLVNKLSGEIEKTVSEKESFSTNSGSCENSDVHLSNEEMNNISLIMDVKLPVKVRIGKKRMLLKDVLNMDIGSVIELNQLANDPLEILVDNNVIAHFHEWMAGTPIPAMTLVVQIEPGPIPTFIPSAPALIRSSQAFAVATFPAITSYFFSGSTHIALTDLTISITPLECPCAVSIIIASIPASIRARALTSSFSPTPMAPATLKRPRESLFAFG